MAVRLALAALAVPFVAPATASALTLHGKASVYANDPVIGFVDHGDNNVPALAGASNDRPGIAVMRTDTLGRWWRVCRLSLPGASGCRWVRQTDVGPATWTGRVVDINATASRTLWGIPAWRFPTDEGTWKAVLHGRELTRTQLHGARSERCNTNLCNHRETRR